ncbi:MAG TPA: protein kinase [Polyangia bacterium]|nr:protein kinase [Polyangia bacterium]
MTDAPDPRIGTTLEGRYRISDRLAAGGMGVVYKGELTAIGKPVAVKFLHDALTLIPDVVKRFGREAQAMSKLAHPNLVSVLDSGLDRGTPFLVMDFVSGKSLAELLADGPLPAGRAAVIARQILAGVKAAHANHVVHRDLKPDNIVLLDGVEGDFVKILDFGLAKMMRGDDSASQLTNTGFALGTPGYMSPEQARGTEADERSDLYAVGVILYHMVTGRKPFIADSPLAVLRMHMDDPPTPPNQLAPRSCSPELEKVILRAMEKDPGDRFQTASAMTQALVATPEGRESVGDDRSSPVRRAPVTMPGTRRGLREMLGTGLRVGVALAVVVGGVMLWRGLSHHEQQKVKRRIDDAVKMAQGAFESAKEGAKVITEDPQKKPTTAPQPSAKREAPQPLAKKEAPATAPVVKKEEPPPVAKKEEPSPAKKEEPVAKNEPPPTPAAPASGASATPPQADDDDDDTPEEPAPPIDTPGAKLEAQQARAPEPAPPPSTPAAKNAPKGPSAAQARAELAAGKVDSAIQTLYAVRRKTKGSAEVALLLGHAYFKKSWRTDGLREYDTAIKLMPSLRYNGALVRDTVGALDGPTHHLAYSVIWTRIGKPALPDVRRMSRSAKNPRTRARAAHLAAQLSHRRR